MKKIKTLTAVLLCLVSLLSVCSCGTKSAFKAEKQTSIGDDKFDDITESTVVLENERIKFSLDTTTTHFIVSDKLSGREYSSVPQFACSIESESITKRFYSELVLQYFDSNSAEYFMYSTADSVEKGNCQILRKENTVRIIYTFGDQKSDIFAPKILSADVYNKIFDNLSSSKQRRLKLYYTLYSAENKPDDYQTQLENYPILSKSEYYLLNENVSDINRADISEYMEAAGYDNKQYEKFLKESGISEKESDEPGFKVAIDYTLNNDGFTAEAVTDQISEKSKSYKLGQIELLPYYAASSEKDSGYFIVPDGSGAIIELNTTKSGTYKHRFYGEDVSLFAEEVTMLSKNQYLPIFCQYSDGGYLAVVESGAALCDLNVRTKSEADPANSAWVAYNYRTVDYEKNAELGTSGGSAEGRYNLYSDAGSVELPRVRYILLNSTLTLGKIAQVYRNYLSESSKLPKSADNTKLLLDFTCVMGSSRSIFGIPYTEKKALTTISQISDTLQQLYDDGIDEISVRLIGYDKNALNYGVKNEMSLYKKVGTYDELNKLQKLVEAHGGTVYLDADFQSVYTDRGGDGFSERKDSSYYLNKQLVHNAKYNVVTRKYNQNGARLVSALRYPKIAANFLASLNKKNENLGVAYINAGNLLGGSYNRTASIDRTAAMQSVQKAIEASAGKTKVLIGGGNQYSLYNATTVTDLAITSSDYDIEAYGVPFWQMVMQNNLSYSSFAYNLSDDSRTLKLNSFLTGCSFHFSLIGADDDILLDSETLPSYHSMNAKEQMETIKALIKEMKSIEEITEFSSIEEYTRLGINVYRTDFKNGSYIIVNLGDSEFKMDTISLSAYSYIAGKEK